MFGCPFCVAVGAFLSTSDQGGISCGKLASACEDSVGLRPSLVLSPKSSVLRPPPKNRKHCIFLQTCQNKNNVCAPKNLIFGILVANVVRISTYALWGQHSGSLQLVRIPRDLCWHTLGWKFILGKMLTNWGWIVTIWGKLFTFWGKVITSGGQLSL